ncbi:MAG: AMP-binding protein [Betaproteobacteria bacterium]|nr:AMP-binding protein [Betaproteobacteria bacterium]
MTINAETLDTFPRLLLHHVRRRGTRSALREKDLGIWQTWTWTRFADEVRSVACGLAASGFQRGSHLAIVGDNRPRLYAAMCAAQCLGGVPVPLYQDAVAAEMAFVIRDAEIEFAVAEDQEQVDKLLEIMPDCPALKHVIYDNPRGLRHYETTHLTGWDVIQAQGREFDARQPDFFLAELARGAASDVAVILYTSGTTGNPKGVAQTHAAMIHTARVLVEFDHIGEDEDLLCYLPMAWVGDFLYSYAQMLIAGFCLNCPESPETVMTDLREIGPTYFFAPPRIYENVLTQVMIRIEDAGWLKRRMFHAFMGVARRVGMKIMEGRSGVALADRLLYALGEVLVYGPLKNVLGFSRIRAAYTGGEAIGPDLFDFYRSLGINLKQLYGMTETCVTVCMQPSGQVKLDTVGPPMPGVEVRIIESGEVLVRSPGVMKEYYKRPDATREAIDAEGFFHTGDAGYFDADGHLKIIDRAKDVGQMADGTLFAPKYLENKLKFFPWIREAVAFGDRRKEACAFINIDPQAVGNWAEKRHLAYTGYTDLASRAEVYELVRGCVEKVNADLAREPEVANSQIHRFLILHKELDADDGELTRTRKVRRGHIGEKYANLVEALYGGKSSVHVEAQVKYEDGRSGIYSADLRIAEAQTFSRAAAREAA